MGNEVGSISRLGISALATTTPAVEKDHLLQLKTLFLEKIKSKTDEEKDRLISREELLDCLNKINVKIQIHIEISSFYRYLKIRIYNSSTTFTPCSMSMGRML